MDKFEAKDNQTENAEFLNKICYVGICNNEEIERVLHPKNAWDVLLKKRADIIADNPRYFRVFLRLFSLSNDSSLEKLFNDKHYKDYINLLNKRNQNKCKQVAYGDVFSNDFNGYAAYDKTYGTTIYLNESLKYFCNFINLALLEQDEFIPEYIKLNALRIAIRISLKTEAMDFILDPRGIIPIDVFKRIKETSRVELQYITGHEFSHFLCGHLNKKNITNKEVLSIGEQKYYENVFNISQQQELEADVFSIKNAKCSKKELQNILRAALIWFSSLELVEYVQDIIAPSSNSCFKTHPTAKGRCINIKKVFYINKSIRKELNVIQQRVGLYKNFLAKDISINYDFYDMYGSAYLDKPNTQWRGRELIDRKDY